MKQTTIAKRHAPSINAEAMIMDIRMSFAASGWRAIASIAEEPILPIPIAAARAAIAAPSAAPKVPMPKFVAAAAKNVNSNIVVEYFVVNIKSVYLLFVFLYP